ncbi:MAG: pyridoxamine 5-phosphate oxidase [Acidimicrobiia bacterium]|nr:pyridoxamine 5-phosphate oxidase [Acidimicrobiia bacterium]
MLAPSPAERARTVLSLASSGVLATLDADFSPLVAPVPFVDDGAGHPVLVLSRLNPHTDRAWLDPRAGMAVGDRLSLQGRLLAMNGSQQLAVQDRYLRAHPDARGKVESLDFAWFRLEVVAARWLDDDGDPQGLTAPDLADAEPDPLAPVAHLLLADLRDRLAEDLLLIARTIGGQPYAEAAVLTGIDRYGLALRVDNPSVTRTIRISFPKRLDSRAELHPTIGYLVRSLPLSEAVAGANGRALLHERR